MLSRDKALAKFLASPDFYTSSKDTLAIPPPRIMVSGAFGTGKSALVGELHKILRNVPVVDFEKFFAGHLATYPAAQRATFAALQVKKESLPVEVVSAAISKLYTMEPFCSRGFIVDGFPRTKDDAAALQATPNIAVDLLLSLRAEVDVILKRKLQQVTEPMTVEQRVDVQTTIMERYGRHGCSYKGIG